MAANPSKFTIDHAHEIKIPGWLAMGGNCNKPLQIVMFCVDACPTTAIGCVGLAYAKQDKTVTLIGSKNKIVSQKSAKFTVPQLELMAMVMGVNYAETLRSIYDLTDSEIALSTGYGQTKSSNHSFIITSTQSDRNLNLHRGFTYPPKKMQPTCCTVVLHTRNYITQHGFKHLNGSKMGKKHGP
jgi:hypothetical protein